jgi:hypothetical protein
MPNLSELVEDSGNFRVEKTNEIVSVVSYKYLEYSGMLHGKDTEFAKAKTEIIWEIPNKYLLNDMNGFIRCESVIDPDYLELNVA